MPNGDDPKDVGYCKPPKRTQFKKGQSGNPKGRPKGSKSFATGIEQANRELINVVINGQTRRISKFDASMMQLTNKAASGDLKAINELRCWLQWMADAQQAAVPQPTLNENDSLVMASIVYRIQNSEETPLVEKREEAEREITEAD